MPRNNKNRGECFATRLWGRAGLSHAPALSSPDLVGPGSQDSTFSTWFYSRLSPSTCASPAFIPHFSAPENTLMIHDSYYIVSHLVGAPTCLHVPLILCSPREIRSLRPTFSLYNPRSPVPVLCICPCALCKGALNPATCNAVLSSVQITNSHFNASVWPLITSVSILFIPHMPRLTSRALLKFAHRPSSVSPVRRRMYSNAIISFDQLLTG